MIDLYRLLEAGLEFFGVYYGVYRAQVKDNNDPENLGRLQIWCPQIHGRDYPKVWAFPIATMAATKAGFWAIPDVGEWVYVQFDHGRPEYPMWGAGWWERGGTTPDMVPGKVVVCTPEGMKVVIDRNALSILVQQSQGNSVLIDDTICKVKHTTKVSVAAGEVDIVSDGDVKLTAQGNLSLSVIGNVSMISTGDVKIDGATNVEVSSAEDLLVAAAGKVTLKSDTNVDVSSTQKITIEAPQAALNIGDLEITGHIKMTGDVDIEGNGNVNGSWRATINSAHHTHPVVNGVAQAV